MDIGITKKMYFPISLSEIKAKVEKKRKSFSSDLLFEYKRSNVKEITNTFGEKLVRVDGDIPVDLPIENGQRFLFISYEQSRYSHGIHKYPAKFFPELPRWLIKRFSHERNIVLDPFTGSGTSNVEALFNRRHSVGIDVDPFARFLSRVKTTAFEISEFRRSYNVLLKKVVMYHPDLVDPQDIPDFPYRDSWFTQVILQELAYIRKIIIEMDTDTRIKDFFLVSFSSIIRQVSNADNNCTRTVVRKKLNKHIYPSMALTSFVETLLINAYRFEEFLEKAPSDVTVRISDDDARYIDVTDDYFDFALTSPPYANAVDYPRTHQLEIYWLGLASGSLNPLKKLHVGTEAVTASDYRNLHTVGEEMADEKIHRIFEKDPRRAFIAYKYMKDMNLNLKEVFRVLNPGSKYVLVVGNNQIRGEVFESWKYLMNLAEKIGYRIENYFGSEIINHFIKVPREERINTDWIIVLKK